MLPDRALQLLLMEGPRGRGKPGAPAAYSFAAQLGAPSSQKYSENPSWCASRKVYMDWVVYKDWERVARAVR
jgi:hypothetical protein